MEETKIPRRWRQLSAVGRVVEGTRFVAFKAPMDERHFAGSSLAPAERFTPRKLVDHLAADGKRLGLVIDIAASAYYPPSEWERLGVRYLKLRCKPATMLRQRRQFVDAVKRFLAEETDENVLVGVHCLHGVNRTGYMIASFLVSELGVGVDEAIRRFEAARGHSIESTRKRLEADARNGFRSAD